MWTKLKARHYSILVLFAIVALETSAIAVDRLMSRGDATAFEVSGSFQNNAFIDRFRMAEANAAPAPARLSQVAVPRREAPVMAIPGRVQPPSITIAGESAKGREPGRPGISIAGVTPMAAPSPASTVVPAYDRWLDYSVGKGDSLAELARQFNLTADQLAQVNGISDSRSLKAGQKIKIPAVTSRMLYTVREGDTLSRIASRFGVPLQELIRSNSLKNHMLSESQKLEIPVRGPAAKLDLVRTETAAVASRDLAMVPSTALTMIRGNELQIVKAEPKPAAPAITVAGGNSAPAITVPSTQPSVVAANLAAQNATALFSPRVQAGKTIQVAQAAAGSAMAPAASLAPIAPAAPAVTVVPAAPAITVAAAPAPAPTVAPTGDDEIKIVSHTVKNGDSLATLARQYKTSITQILSSNTLNNSSLKVGQQVKVPVSKKFYRVLQVTSRRADVSTGNRLVNPVRGARVTDRYGWRTHPVYRRKQFHAGLDLAAPRGTAISAAAGGTVVYAGWMSGYGRLVVIRHPNGFSTRYGHCSSLKVRKGQTVRAGQTIGGVGATGTATGNHLHFEVRRNGHPVNPSTALGWR